ncbi:ATP-binding cassette domain-containing protein [Pseudorhodobacter turbinis]|uniref:ATP-binding cassette domain-containing protein n=1 Tax=Pseudorhodobacter turbinis TaxID=2500533 RepID=A0A4P8ECH0_9RHOB|nr:ATP-binding cassette domain-containing protein [Pseudorhodobacter turbinis]
MCFQGRQLDLSDKRAVAQLRGPSLSMIFQDPMSALDPVMTVRRHLALRTKSDPIPILQQAGLADPEPLLESYAHQLSGGQCQRIAIACALAHNPKVLIADEPTTALDVTVQAGILKQLNRLASDRDMAIIIVTHDLGVVYQLCDRVLVMQQGRVVEQGCVQTVLTAPQHVYTKQMIAALPQPCIPGRKSRNKGIRYDKRRYRRRNRIEWMFGRLKDWRRVSTRYDRCPKVFLSAIALAATLLFWLYVLNLGWAKGCAVSGRSFRLAVSDCGKRADRPNAFVCAANCLR